MAKIERALISVSDKSGIVDFAKGLAEFGVEILSTGGTAKLLKDSGIGVKLVSDYTGFPEMLDGRVKTLHPKIHAGLLARRDNREHMDELKKHDILPIDMVVVNLYPFQETISKPDVKLEDAVENIDIGGPTMLRSAAKNYDAVAVIVNPDRYPEILKELKEKGGELSQEMRQNLVVEVFSHTAGYDTAISGYLSGTFRKEFEFPEVLNLSLTKAQELRYGENPHQKACFYKDPLGRNSMKQLHGKELSFNNFLDIDSAFAICSDFEKPSAVVIKHTNPCGAASAETLSNAYSQALACDPVSAFGSIVGLNREVDEKTAKEINSASFVEAVVAPGFTEAALEILKGKKNIRLITLNLPLSPFTKGGVGDLGRGIAAERIEEGSKGSFTELDFKKIQGGMLLQEKDMRQVEAEKCQVVSERKPAEDEFNSLIFAWKVVKHVKSNAIVLVHGTRTVGIGAGQMSRVDSVKIASRKAGELAKGSVMASDAFFPFPDAIDESAKAGVKAIIQPGGSLKDKEVIEAVNKHGIAMVFTGMRHFKH